MNYDIKPELFNLLTVHGDIILARNINKYYDGKFDKMIDNWHRCTRCSHFCFDVPINSKKDFLIMVSGEIFKNPYNYLRNGISNSESIIIYYLLRYALDKNHQYYPKYMKGLKKYSLNLYDNCFCDMCQKNSYYDDCEYLDKETGIIGEDKYLSIKLPDEIIIRTDITKKMLFDVLEMQNELYMLLINKYDN